MSHDWPGNIRELKNVVERSVYRNCGENRPIEHIILDPFASPYRPTTRVRTLERQVVPTPHSTIISPPTVTAQTDTDVAAPSEAPLNDFSFPLDFKEQTERYEMELIQQALSASQYNQKKTAEILGLTSNCGILHEWVVGCMWPPTTSFWFGLLFRRESRVF